MNRYASVLAGCLLFAVAGRAHSVEPPATPRVVAIVGARVIPMTGERVIDDATVLVADGVIRAVGSAESIAIPKDTRVITGRGKFLIPGLGEMHAHVPSGPTPEFAQRYVNTRRQLIRALHEGGVGMLLGSDAPQVFNVPGFAVHRELQVMVAAGLTPYEALRTATAAPAEFFDATGAYGTIVVGADADMVLLGNDPLQDIANTQSIEGVMVRGRWLDRAYLDRGLQEIAKRMAAQ